MSTAISGMGSNWAAQAMTGASMRMPPAQKMSNVYAQIDTSNAGTISKSQFTQAFSSLNPPASFKSLGAEALFSRLDTNNSGSVSKQQFVSGMTKMMTDVRQLKHQDYSQQATPTTPTQTINASMDGLSRLGKNIDVMA
jgi:Ca2+-binding EF-hand superfamily protein